jgi:O-antigen/teichoic acid export membrane protein
MKFSSLFKSEIVRNSSTLLSGNIVGQAIAFAAYPLLTRIYSEADFGIFATYTTVCSLLTIVGTGRYEESLVIAKNERETSALLGFSLKWLAGFSLFIFILLSCFGQPLLATFKLNDFAGYWLYIPLSVLFSGIIVLLNNLAIRKKKFRTIASANVVQSASNAVFKLSFGGLSFTKFGLVISNVISLVAAAFVYFPLKKHMSIDGKRQSELQTAWKYRDFPTYNLIRSLLNQVSNNLPFLYLIGFFDAERLGIFSLAFFVLTAPINLIINSLFTTFFETFSTAKKTNAPILPVMKSYWKGLCLYILPIFVLAFLVAKPLFAFIFGSQWETAGTYFQYMLPWGFMLLMTNSFYSVFIVFEKQKSVLLIDFLYLIARFFSLYVGVCMKDFNISIMLFALSGIIFTSIFMARIYFIVRKYERITNNKNFI